MTTPHDRAGARAARLLALVCATAMAAAAAAQDCLVCHGACGRMSQVVDAQRSTFLVDEALFARSVHAGFACGDCHVDYEEFPHPEGAGVADCEGCHDDYAEELAGSVHGPGALPDGAAVACSACHGVHDVLPPSDPDSRLHPLRSFRVCGQCHFEEGHLDTASIDELLTSAFMDRAHAKGLLGSGLTVSASCVSCHGGHDIRALGDPASRVSREHVAQTCGACHLGVVDAYHAGVHGAPRPDGGPNAAEAPLRPTCSDCHEPHRIVRTDMPAFRVAIVEECGSCHERESSTYHETFHGKMTTLGGARAAKCQDCHGPHRILPASDPASSLSSVNIVGTCGRCHEGAHASFTEYLPHATHDDRERWPWLFYAFWGMTGLLVGTMAGAFAHTLLFLVRLLFARRHWIGHKRAARAGGAQVLYRRFDRTTRSMHMLMIVSFLTLAVTGMMLKFSWTAWAEVVTDALGGVETTGILHRLAALLLVGVFVWHVLRALRIKREKRRSWWQLVNASDSILFNPRDVKEVWQTFKWFFFLGPRPRYGRFTYWEKFDYFAVFWGVFIIGTTGFALWFPVQATHLVPGWMLNVAGIIHGDEALLASAFIFTVHFFNANFRPDKFPMDMTMFTGRMTLEELQYERPREYEDLVQSGELEQHLVGPMPDYQVRALRIFASIALLIGVGLVGLIAYALVGHLPLWRAG